MAMNVGTAGNEDVMVEINTTPLIDVMLVLLIMFIITIPIQTHALKLQMPISQSTLAPPPPQAVRIDIAGDGTIRWNGELVPDRPALEQKLAAVAAQADQPQLQLRPDQHVAYKVVAAVLASAQRQRVTRIAMAGNEQYR
jgi:biopolymer transport protein ExbD